MLLYSLLFLVCVLSVHSADVDPEKCEAYGPGLEPHKLALPVYYFFINVVDEEGNRWVKGTSNIFYEPFLLIMSATGRIFKFTSSTNFITQN